MVGWGGGACTRTPQKAVSDQGLLGQHRRQCLIRVYSGNTEGSVSSGSTQATQKAVSDQVYSGNTEGSA